MPASSCHGFVLSLTEQEKLALVTLFKLLFHYIRSTFECINNGVFSKMFHQYKLSYTILNNVKVYEEPVSRTKEMSLCSVEFEADEENRIEYESFTCEFSEFRNTFHNSKRVGACHLHVPARYMLDTVFLNRLQFMLQWCICFPKFAESSAFVGKTPMQDFHRIFPCEQLLTIEIPLFFVACETWWLTSCLE